MNKKLITSKQVFDVHVLQFTTGTYHYEIEPVKEIVYATYHAIISATIKVCEGLSHSLFVA